MTAIQKAAILTLERERGRVTVTRQRHHFDPLVSLSSFFFFTGSLYGWRFPLPYCDQKMANVAGVTAIHESGSGKNTIRLVKHTAM